MEILKGKGEPKAPRFVYEDWASKYLINPAASRQEKIKWWKQEEEYWRQGRFGLVGPHYFALTQGTMKHATGAKIRPVWRDVDEEDIYGTYMYARDHQSDLLIFKRREIGLSAIFGGIIPMWTALTMEGSTSLMTSADKPRLEAMFKDKLRPIYDNLHPDYRPSNIADRQSGYLHLGKKESDGSYSGKDSQIITKETVDNPQAFEAYRAMHVFVDEFFLHPKADRVLRSSQASVKSGFMKLAPIVLGGSAGESSIEGQRVGEKLWANADALGLICVFIPGWKGIMEAPEIGKDGKATGKVLNFCPNGHSDEKKATQWIMETRERLDKLEDKSFLEVFIKQYPLTVQEVISANAKGALPEDIKLKISARERILVKEKVPRERGYMAKDEEGRPVFKPSDTGLVHILERPNPKHTYIAGIDPIPFISTELTKGSKNCIAIKNLDLQRYVAFFMERDDDPINIVQQSILLQDWYNSAPAMLEINRGGVIKDKYKSLERLDLLARKPSLLSKEFKKSGDGAYGYYKNDHTGQRGNEYFFKYLRNFMDEVYFTEILEESKQFLVENTDLVDAIICTEILNMQIIETQKRDTGTTKKTEVREIPVLKYQNGRYVRTVQRVVIQKPGDA